MKLKLACFIVFINFLSGCSYTKNFSENEVDAFRSHQIYIDKNGSLRDPVTKLIVSDEVSYVDGILKDIKESRASEVVIFIHGGLNTFESSTDRVKDINPKKVLTNEGKYLLFISWHSGPFTNYGDHLFKLRRGANVGGLRGFASSPFIFLEDIVRSVARIPVSSYNVVFGQNSVRKKKYSVAEASADRAQSFLKSKGFSIFDSPVNTGMTTKDWWSVANPTKLVTAPFVDALGSGAWNSMLRRADLVMVKDLVFNSPPNVDTSTAVAKFLEKYPVLGGDGIETTIIAHSMGAIIANNIISSYPHIEFSNIVYMAAACRLKDLGLTIAPYIEKNRKSKFYNLSLSPYRDIAENTKYDFVPRGSLLMWIDDTFGSTNSFQDRTAGYWLNIVRGADVAFSVVQDKKRIHLTQFAIKGQVPLKHGDFGDFKFWDENFWLGYEGVGRSSN